MNMAPEKMSAWKERRAGVGGREAAGCRVHGACLRHVSGRDREENLEGLAEADPQVVPMPVISEAPRWPTPLCPLAELPQLEVHIFIPS